MIITKEKIVLLVAAAIFALALLRSLSNYSPPGSVGDPEPSEAPVRYAAEDELMPTLSSSQKWTGEGRNPFTKVDGYIEEQPVPLRALPELPPLPFIPRPHVGEGFLARDAVELAPPKIDPERRVEEPKELAGD